jgi:NADH-quinone oxidoreductase subunit M
MVLICSSRFCWGRSASSAPRPRSRTALKTYYGWFLVLQAAMTGVFAARDLILFYICFEFTLIPMFILISLYGSTNRARPRSSSSCTRSRVRSSPSRGLVYVAWFAATRSHGRHVDVRSAHADAVFARDACSDAGLGPGAMLLGFAVKVPLFPVHTWLPLAHTEAPTAGSVILAGVLLKLGTYGIYRFVLPFAPAAVVEYAPFIAGLSIVGILYGGLICWVQTDVKKLVAYSSVAHLGLLRARPCFVQHDRAAGAVLYMINHGLSTGALFLLIGMVYERYHTRDMGAWRPCSEDAGVGDVHGLLHHGLASAFPG